MMAMLKPDVDQSRKRDEAGQCAIMMSTYLLKTSVVADHSSLLL